MKAKRFLSCVLLIPIIILLRTVLILHRKLMLMQYWQKVKDLYKAEEINDIDGVKIDFPDKWVHLRKSNTEPIIRVYSEAATMEAADELGKQIMDIVYSLAK